MSDYVIDNKLIQRLLADDPEAERLVFDHYAPRLLKLTQKHLNKKFARRLDADDVVQSVFRTFFRRQADGQFRIESSARMWQLLVKITVLKTRSKIRYHSAKRRDVNAEAGSEEDDLLGEAPVSEPGPADAAVLIDLIETLFQGLHEVHARVLEMRLGGYSSEEIANELGVSRRTVNRAQERIREKLLGYFSSDLE